MMNHIQRILVFLLLTTPLANQAKEFAVTENLHIRSLAASCAACHGTNGNTTHPDNKAPSSKATLAGMDKDHFIKQINAFISGERKSTVMHHHAKGLSVDEIAMLAAFFAEQKPQASSKLQHQALEANHD